ncbi:MAG: efflux RND transporter periplasmic adaptor subunit [Lachnospiraceae bacterium]|nr:efflux RND transporter periplasmic adaptor subunit [Lachnospiraceae bacterium]
MKEKLNKILNKSRPQEQGRKKNLLSIVIILLTILVTAVILIAVLTGKEEEVTYKETEVIKGTLSAGITESGSVDIGTTVQSFELDISEFTGTSSFSFNGGQITAAGGFQSMGGMQGGQGGGMDQLMSMFSGQAQTSSGSSANRQLEIEEVFIEAGQEIQEGDPVLKLTEETVNSIRNELTEDVSSAKLVYDQAITAGKQSDTEAESAYKTNTLYGSYAQAEYNQTVGVLEDAVTLAEENLAQTQEDLMQAQTDLAEKEALLAEQKQVLENAIYAEENTSQETDLYWWIIAYQTMADAQDMVTSLEEDIEQLKEDIETYTEQEKESQTSLLLAQKDLESGKITATGELDKRKFNAENAQEIYDVSVEQSSFEIQNAKEDYDAADLKLQEFDAVIKEQVIHADSSGVVTELFITPGDALTQNMELFYLNDYDAVTITLSVAEEDMETVQAGGKINVTVAAFPEEVFSGSVTEIGDAEIDSNTNKTLYTVTVTVENMGSLLYQDMTAEVTFVTDEAAEVLYVPNRAITEKDGVSYVKVKSESGKVVEKEVVCGFTDGINTEIKEGLTEGETVLLESKVKKG